MHRILALSLLLLLLLAVGAAGAAPAAGDKKKDPADLWAGLELRPIGPALTSGRVVDIAVSPADRSTWFVAVASGGVWKTANAGTTFEPVFDGEGSYSIGCVTIDPKDPLTVWVGSGENNGQRSVSYGDGVYKSVDGGKTWKNMGLKSSEHIGRILFDPRDSSTVYVAAQGPLWNPGGDRGLYKTTDGGATWKAVLTVSENTGVTDVALDPRNPNVLYAAAWQRRRHVWTQIDGGPESALYKSTDADASWRKLEAGLPKEEMGRIGLAVAPSSPDTVYAVIEAARTVGEGGGFYASTDRGETWKRRSGYVPGGPMYYNEIFVDPVDPDRVYSVDVFLQVTDDGGRNFRDLGESSKHVDNHSVWIDPADTRHLLVGCDGGIYESFDRGTRWDYKANLPVTQFYRIALDDSRPFYRVYGGTQDSFTLGGPSRTTTLHGITNQDWEVLGNGDGFQPRVDPQNPDIVYSMAQYGALRRFNRRTGEQLYVQPQEAKGEPALRWNWDSPLLISPHSPARLYFGANRLFRSDDRGMSWRPVSGDLTRQIDRNQLPVMGKVWSVDAVAKHASTSLYGNLVALDESPRVEGLLYAGTDDGLVQVSEDGGGSWRKVERFPGVPDRTYVSRLTASRHDASTVYAAFDNHKTGDYKPYLLKSADRGRTWTSIAGDLPARETVYVVIEDPVSRDLLFAGTEFGLYFTRDGGRHWVQLKGGLPTIQIRDLAIHEREDDLVIGTFGYGIYILDDISPLRIAPEVLEREAALFPVQTAWLFSPSTPLGYRDKSFQGDSLYSAPNPPFGAVFTWHLKEDLRTRRDTRKEREKKEPGEKLPYPTPAELRAEAAEEDPALLFTISDSEGRTLRRLTAPAKAGLHRIAWDLRWPPADPADLTPPLPENPYVYIPTGPLVAPGTYRVSLAQRVDGKETPLGEPQTFEVKPLFGTDEGSDPAALQEMTRKASRLQRAALGAMAAVQEAEDRLALIKQAVLDTPEADPRLGDEARSIESRLRDVRLALAGDAVLRGYNEPVPPAILDRIGVLTSQFSASAPPTGMSLDAYEIAAGELEGVLGTLRQLVEVDLKRLEEKLETAGAPWTPGRVPVWSKE